MPAGWRATRARVMARDGWRCRRCGAPAAVCDHIDRMLPLPLRESDANLQALCQPCSDRKSQAEAAAARTLARP